MTARKQTSSRISTKAARLLAKLPKRGIVDVRDWGEFYVFHSFSVRTLRSLLASLVSQDETKGQAKSKKRAARRGRK